MTTEEEEVKAYTLVNRVIDVRMKGSYGYLKKSFREGGGSMLTAESTVKEFVVDKLEMVDLPHWGKQHCFIGTDYYGREMSLPISRILSFSPKDTYEQGRLKDLLGLQCKISEYVDGADPTVVAIIMENMGSSLESIQHLQKEGIELYVPKRATEDEL